MKEQSQINRSGHIRLDAERLSRMLELTFTQHAGRPCHIIERALRQQWARTSVYTRPIYAREIAAIAQAIHNHRRVWVDRNGTVLAAPAQDESPQPAISPATLPTSVGAGGVTGTDGPLGDDS